MPTEIELKLAIAPQSIPMLREHPILNQWSVDQHLQQLVTTYFDTPDYFLRKSGYVIRIRQMGDVLKQTIKTSSKSTNGLHMREEWEKIITEFTVDFSDFPDKKVREELLKSNIEAQITPVFKTEFMRDNWHLVIPNNAEILLSLDQGNIIAGDLSEPICEVELELIKGNENDLHSIAGELQKSIALLPENAGKAGRGYRLAKKLING